MISAIIAQNFIPTAEFLVPTGRETYEINTECKIQPVTVEAKISKFST